MATISQRELRNQSASIMDRVEAGEQFTVTRNGRPVAELTPIGGPPYGVPSEKLLAALADIPPIDLAELRAEADALFGDDRIG
jgi:prevent-host-death family protein